MSQKTAKRIRRLEAQMTLAAAILETHTNRLDHLSDWQASSVAGRKRTEDALDRITRRAEARAYQDVRKWQRIAISAISAAILVELIAAAIVHTKAAEAPALPPEEPTTVTAVLPLEEPEEAENERIEAALLARSQVIADCTITFYCNEQYPHICGTGDGIAADGTPALAWATCAVDPEVIPLGSTVMVDLGDGYGLRILQANDTGVSGSHLDICVGSHQEALEQGIQTANVHWCIE